MRSLRWLLLVIIAVVAAGVFQVYRLKRQAGKAAQRPLPATMAREDKATAFHYEWGQSANGKPNVYIQAREMHQSADLKMSQLKDIELQMYQANGKFYDRVTTDYAEFSVNDHKLYAPHDADITLDVPVTGEPKHHLTSIKASGINFDSDTGKAQTDKHVAFEFENGTGESNGASYDPVTHEIHLISGVTVFMKSKDPKGRPMKVETEDLVYSESSATVRLSPWSKMTRDQTVMESGATTVNLKSVLLPNGEKSVKIDNIDAPKAHGTDKQKDGRNLDYSADLVKAYYNEHGEMEKLEATGNAHLVSHAETADTTMSAARLNLFFTATQSDSVLSSAQARGNAVLESKPLPVAGGLTLDTRNVRSEAVDVFMKPDGKDLDRVSTLAPGTMEFFPNQPAHAHRSVKSDRMLIRYGARNQIQSFHADAASTETHPSQLALDTAVKNKKPAPGIALTSSKTLDAAFDEKGEVKQLQQAGNFRYSEGVRKAQADTAVMDNAKNLMDLDAHARIADDEGSTAANHIQINQVTDEFDARGNVATTHLPDQKPADPKPGPKPDAKDQQAGGMLDPGEALQGKADHVLSANHGTAIHYIGNAQVWQGGSRITADQINIDRDPKQKTLTAEGHVVSQLQDSVKILPDGKPGPIPPTTLVKSQKMVYTDSNRLAVYTGDVTMVRPALTVKCATLQAFMNDGKPVNGKTPDSRIDRALADGKVEITQVAPARQRVGTSEHGEYYTEEGKIILTGGRPYLKDTKAGDATGEKLTYFTNDDKLIYDGAPKQKVEGHILRGKS